MFSCSLCLFLSFPMGSFGKKTTEMDFSSMALRIVYAMEGMDVSKDEDLYDIGLPSWEVQRDPRRKPIKTFINAIMNDETGNFKLPSEAQKLTGVDHKTLHKLVLKRHEKIAHHFSTGVGLKHSSWTQELLKRSR